MTLFHEHFSFVPCLADFFAQLVAAVAEGFIEYHTNSSRIDFSFLVKHGFIGGHIDHSRENCCEIIRFHKLYQLTLNDDRASDNNRSIYILCPFSFQSRFLKFIRNLIARNGSKIIYFLHQIKIISMTSGFY